MATFSGVHGTCQDLAIKVQKDGFLIPTHPVGYSMFGNGAYFYMDSADGRIAACIWAKNHRNCENNCALLHAQIEYDDDCVIKWTQTIESKVQKRIMTLERSTQRPMCNKDKNTVRSKLLAQVMQNSKRTIHMVLVEFFKIAYACPPAKSHYVEGCVVLSGEMLPKPPYRQEVCHE